MRAILIGATGLIGSHLLTQLLEDQTFSEVRVLHRSTSEIAHQKLSWHVVDFKERESWEALVQGNVLFNAMGTTIKKAGSQEAMIWVDVGIPSAVAEAAKNNGVQSVASVSAAGANAKSSVFYNKIKGQLEDKLHDLAFDSSCSLRPSLLVGNRNETRLGEQIMEPIMNVLASLPFLKKYRPIHAADVAKAMHQFSKNPTSGKLILELDEIQDYIS